MREPKINEVKKRENRTKIADGEGK